MPVPSVADWYAWHWPESCVAPSAQTASSSPIALRSRCNGQVPAFLADGGVPGLFANGCNTKMRGRQWMQY
eukprot:CAMPEP_0179478436 /NCGR_PEP_ID=MMETSP0799-20121207/56946_1 /TAXON_ID=46947 /ORGANISM="Geminigera cryophila, Strain CCMP2564" /LENGTH=70 /DNA_ID=CAMNT_0021289605 /DNA_START=524 /DNA_END=736 /DNA_ORIENTATION=+